ncbi:MAG: hypothetical protein FJY66_04360, partial [Calditrichaeota bacterium]|nr:hypothetical protein [Calditrichota bacterium]
MLLHHLILRQVILLFVLVVGVITAIPSVNAAETLLTEWLVAGPAWLPDKAFLDTSKNLAAEVLEKSLLDYETLLPKAGQSFDWHPGTTLTWTKKRAEDSRLVLSTTKLRPSQAYVAFAAAYLESPRWQEVTAKVVSSHPFALYIDGVLLDKATMPIAENRVELTARHALHRGKHLLLLVTSARAESSAFHWEIRTQLETTEELSPSTDPQRALAEYKDYALFDRISQLTLSPDGNLVALIHSHRDKEFERHSHIQVFDARSRKLLQTIEMTSNLSAPFFLPVGRKLAFRVAENEGTSIWMFDFEKATMQQILKPTKDLGHCVPAPDGKFLYYAMDAKKEESDANYTLLTKLEERLTDWTDRRAIYAASLENGATHCLTDLGAFALDEFGLSCEGDKLVFTRRLATTERPYFLTEFWMYELSTGEKTLLLSQPIAFETRPLNLTWLPGGKYVAYTAASHLTEKDEPISHNVSEVDLYLLDIQEKKTTNLSKDALFTVDEGSGLHWNPQDRHLYFVAFVRSQAKVYKVDALGKIAFQEIPLPFSYVESLELADNGSRFAFTASSPDRPSAAYSFDIAKQMRSELADPTAELRQILELAKWERWNFVNSDGIAIDGLLYYPHDFTPEKKWPMIVYFYGGVGPQEENFYFPFHWWAANGYVVYTLTPVGAIGFGQNFADKHVNDWGEL